MSAPGELRVFCTKEPADAHDVALVRVPALMTHLGTQLTRGR